MKLPEKRTHALGIFKTLDDARFATRQVLNSSTRMSVDPDIFHFPHVLLDELENKFLVHQEVTLLGELDGEWRLIFGDSQWTHIGRPVRPDTQIRDEILKLTRIGVSVGANNLTIYDASLKTLQGCYLNDAEVVAVGKVMTSLDSDELAEIASEMAMLVHTSPRWPALVVGGFFGPLGEWFAYLFDEAVEAMGLNGSWSRPAHIPADFPELLLPESWSDLDDVYESEPIWQYLGLQHLVLHNFGPPGWYDVWARTDASDDQVQILVNAERWE